MRRFIVMLVLLVSGPTYAADAGRESRATSHCELREPTFDSREVECSLSPSSDLRRYVLRVNFSGGHDDTMAKMAALLDGVSLPCEDGSKTSLMGEDGDVSLLCLFAARGGPKTSSLVATFTWSHAQYVSYSLSER